MTGTNQPGLYAIIDVIAQSIVQNVITISRHEAPMVRMFTDLLSGKGPIADHPADYQLVRLGYIDDCHQLAGLMDDKGQAQPFQIVLTGERWAKLHQQAQENNNTRQQVAEWEAGVKASPPQRVTDFTR